MAWANAPGLIAWCPLGFDGRPVFGALLGLALAAADTSSAADSLRPAADHLKTLIKKWDNQFILTVASYNASEKAVLGWIQSRYKGDSVAASVSD